MTTSSTNSPPDAAPHDVPATAAHLAPSGVPDGRIRIAVCAGTYRRNEPLRTLLEATLVAAAEVADRASVGVVIVDDNPDGAARPVVDAFDGRFEMGIHYRHIGRGNISLVRNELLAVGSELADWIAMTDDDCEPSPGWLAEFLATQERWGADCVTGRDVHRAAPGSPRWLVEQPFLEQGPAAYADQQEMELAMTSNVFLRTEWLRAHPDVRFAPDLGVVGGEDMVFFRSAHGAGLHIRFAERAVVHANDPPERTTFSYRVRSSYWLGNTEAVTNLRLGTASRGRLLLRAAKSGGAAMARPLQQLRHGRPPQLRFAFAMWCKALGRATGALGWSARHH